MLTSDLVRAHIRKGTLHLSYINPQDADLTALAGTLIGIFDRHRGLTRQELEEELRDFLGVGTSFLVHRGLGKLLDDRCEFETTASVDPVTLREQVFAASALAYRDDEQAGFDREALLTNVGEFLGLSVPEIDRTLYADLKAAEVLTEFKSCSPTWLLLRYNVALAQAALLRATGLDIRVEGQTSARYREVFRKLKFFQLLHTIQMESPGVYHIHIDGPVSLFKSSQRYGLQMAQFLPTLLHCDTWELTATVLWGIERREAIFKLSPSTGLQPIGHSTGQWVPEEVAWLDEQFRKLKTEWEIETEADILPLEGQGVFAPDYRFVHRPTGMIVYMEIFGFWRRGSVQTRLDLLRRHGPPNLIVGLSKELGVDEDEKDALPGAVYVFRTTPIAREIYKLLEGMREEKEAAVT